jgi:cation:H+ antiporter
MDPLVLGLLLVGLVLLVVGGELLVRGASQLAIAIGVSPLVIGLTVVAYGTSAPELAVSVQAGLDGNDGIAVANVVGSNIFNVLFILGLCALLLPLTVSRQLVTFDVPVMIGASLLTLAFAWDAKLGALEGIVLVSLAIVYTVWSIRRSRSESKALQDEQAEAIETIAGISPTWLVAAIVVGIAAGVGKAIGWLELVETALIIWGAVMFVAGSVFGRGGRSKLGDLSHQLAFITMGLGVLVLGARLLVDGAITLASSLGVSETVIGLTIVAGGTSLPEVATSLVATLRGQRDIAIGNVVGSNIFNILFILGLASLVTPGGLTVAPELLALDIWVMVGVAAACLPIFFSGFTIKRWEGALFMACYIAYTVWLIAASSQAEGVEQLGHALLWYFLPLAVVLALATGVRALHRGDHLV